MPAHLSVDLASTRHVNASGTGVVVDTVVTQAGHIVLLAGQNISAYNGVYVVGAGQWQRWPSFDTPAEMLPGTTFYVIGGAENQGTEFYLSNGAPPTTVDAENLYFDRRSYAAPVGATGGLELDVSTYPNAPRVALKARPSAQGVYQAPTVQFDEHGIATDAQSGDFSEGLVEGLEVTRLSANSIEIAEGRAWIPGGNAGAGELLVVNTPITKSGLSLASGAWHYLYLWSNAGTPDVEVSPQIPASPYYRKARVKGGPDNVDPNVTPDETRRYIPRGALYATALNTMRPFTALPGGFVRWTVDQDLLSAFADTGANLFQVKEASIASLVPHAAEAALVYAWVANTSNGTTLYVTAADDGLMPTLGATPNAGQLATSATALNSSSRASITGPVALGAAKALRFHQSAAGGIGNFGDVLGWWEAA